MAKEGKWITVNGNHILIKDGETVEQAMKRQFGENGVRDTGGNTSQRFDDDFDEEFGEGLSDKEAEQRLFEEDEAKRDAEFNGNDETEFNAPQKNKKYIRYPDGTIRWNDEIYPDLDSLIDIAGEGVVNEIEDADEEDLSERDFEQQIEKRFDGWRPHWTNRKSQGGAHFASDMFLNTFDFDNKVYKNPEEMAKYYDDQAKEIDNNVFAKKNPAWAEARKKEYLDNANFIRNNMDRFNKYSKIANDTKSKRQLQLYDKDFDNIRRLLKSKKITLDDIIAYLQ